MPNKNLHDSQDYSESIAPLLRTDGTVEGTAVDLQGSNSAEVIISSEWGDGTVTPSLEESDDNSTWSAVAASNLDGSFAAITSDATDGVQNVGYVGSKRYIRAKIVTASSTSGSTAGAAIERGHLRHSGLNLAS